MKPAAWLPVFALVASPFAVIAQEATPQEVPAAPEGLRFQRAEVTVWYIVFEREDKGKWMGWLMGVDPAKARFGNKNNPKPWLAPEDVFFKDGPMAGRFKFIGFDTKEVKSGRTGGTAWLKVAEYEDLKPNKKGWRYSSPHGLPEADIVPNRDRTAVFTLKRDGQAATAEFKVEEFTNFALPPDGPNKDFFLKEVSEEKVVVEYKDQAGAVRQATIAKHVKDPAEALESLSYVRDEAVQWYLVFGLESDGLWAPRLVARLGEKRLDERIVGRAMLRPGDFFFEDHQFMKNRFKFLGLVDKEIKNPKSGLTEKTRVAEFEDRKHNKKGFKYESIKDLPENEIASRAYYDRTAVFAIKVPGKDQAVEFKIEELTNFSLPPDGPGRDFFLKEISPDKVTIEYKDQAGILRSVTIPKRPQEPVKR